MDWQRFFKDNKIPFVTSGKNVARGNVAIHCPWCGVGDPSEHLSVSIRGDGFRCWRNRDHSGKNPAKLIQALLKCSWERAEELAGHKHIVPDNFMGRMKAALNKQEEKVYQLSKLKLPDEFKRFNSGVSTYSFLPSARPFVNYLRTRKFTHDDILKTKHYGMYYATRGDFAGRVLFTIWDGKLLVGWTGRTIYADENLRYKSLTSDRAKAEEQGFVAAPNPIGHYLLFEDIITNAPTCDVLVLCEGPFDAWRVNLLGARIGVCATCFFTNTPSKQQLARLHGILPRFDRTVLLLDNEGTFAKAENAKAALSSFKVEVARLPEHLKDPGEMTSREELKKVLAIE